MTRTPSFTPEIIEELGLSTDLMRRLEELLERASCPLCGGECRLGTIERVVKHGNRPTIDQGTLYFVNCLACPANNRHPISDGFPSPAAAVAHWVKRAPRMATDQFRDMVKFASDLGGLFRHVGKGSPETFHALISLLSNESLAHGYDGYADAELQLFGTYLGEKR